MFPTASLRLQFGWRETPAFAFAKRGLRSSEKPMRKVLVSLVLFAVLPSLAATKTTVEQLQSVLADLHQQNRSDETIANRLKDISLIEQLTPPTLATIVQNKPGPLTAAQLRILVAESALLPPPASELPSDPVPDHNAQTVIINRAIDYIVHQNSQLPRLSAQKETTRFQNGVTQVQTETGTYSSFAGGNPGNASPTQQYLKMQDARTMTVQIDKGIELPPSPKKYHAPQPGEVSPSGGGLVLGLILMDASKNDLHFVRWQSVEGKKAAVFSFTVDKNNSHYKVSYCCFPVIENIGGAGSVNASPTMPAMMAQPGGTSATFRPFTANPGYHGEFFIDPDTGVVVRVITSAELKPTDIVQQENIRIDYGAVNVDGKPLIVPTHSFTQTELAPNGDALVKYALRRTIIEANFKNYTLADVPRGK
jgi:hypothetical protein